MKKPRAKEKDARVTEMPVGKRDEDAHLSSELEGRRTRRRRRFRLLREGLDVVFSAEQKATSVIGILYLQRIIVSRKSYQFPSLLIICCCP